MSDRMTDLEKLKAMLRGSMAARPAPAPEEENLDVAIEVDESPEPKPPPSPNAVQVTEFDRWRAKDVLRRSKQLREDLALGEDRIHSVEDFHALSYELEPQLETNCQNQARADFVQSLVETPAYHALHASTALNADTSEMATHHFASEYAKLVQEQEKKAKERAKRKKPSKEQAEQDALEDQMATLGAAGKAVQDAAQEVEEFKDASRAFGSEAGAENTRDTGKSRALFQRLRNNQKMRRIVEQAGRFRQVARAKQRLRADHGMEDTVGIMLTGDPGKILPHELVSLMDEDLWLMQFARMNDQALMGRHQVGVAHKGKGPIVVAIDESGSMSNVAPCGKGVTFEDLAKAMALAFVWIARKQNRWISLIGWSSEHERRVLTIAPGGRVRRHDFDGSNFLEVSPVQDEETELFSWLEHFFGGGTRPPLENMPALFSAIEAPEGQTDVILITDDELSLQPQAASDFLAWKAKSKAKLLTFSIGCECEAMKPVSDEVFNVGTIDAHSDAVGQAFSI